MNARILGPVRTTRRVAATVVVVLVAALVALVVPSASGADDPPVYPSLSSTFLSGGTVLSNVYSPSAGVVDLLDPAPGSGNPTPATVVGASEPTALQGVALLRTDLSDTPLGDVTLADLRLQSLPLEIPLSTIPITRSGSPRTWTDLLAPTALAGIPLQHVTWKQAWALSPRPAVLAQITLDEVDFTGSVLADLPLAALALGGADVSTIEIPPQPGQDQTAPFEDRWCALLNATRAGSCPNPELLVGATLLEIGIQGAPLKNIPLKNIPLKNIDLETSPLKNIPLKNIVLDVAPLKNIPLKNIDLAASPLKNIPLKNIDFATSPLKNIPLKNIDLTGSGLGGLPLAAVDWATAPIGHAGLDQLDLTSSLLAPVPLSATTAPEAIARCDDPAGWCDADPTIGEAAAAGAVRPGATLADIGADGFAGDRTLADLLAARTPGSTLDPTLGDLRLDLAGGPDVVLGALLAALDTDVPDVVLGDLRFTSGDALLGWVFGFMLDPDLFAAYLLGDVGTWTDGDGRDITLGDLGTWTTAAGVDITLGQLAEFLDGSVSLADVLLGLVPASAFPFEEFPIDSLGVNQSGRRVAGRFGFQPNVPTEASIRLLNPGALIPTEPVTAEILLPSGSRFVSIAGQVGTDDAVDLSDVRSTVLADGRTRVRAGVPSIQPSGTPFYLDLVFDNPVRLGTVPVPVSLVAADGSVTGSTEFELPLEEWSEPNSPDEEWGAFTPEMPTNPDACSATSPSCAGLDAAYIDAMIPGFIDRAADVDWYVLPDVRAGARVAADLTNLPLDADVVLYGPSGIATSPTLFPAADEPLPGRLVEDAALGVGRAAASLAAQALAELRLDQGREIPDSGGVVVPPLTPLSVSLHRGTEAETVGAVAPVDGDYVVAVTGYNAATSNEPYLLRARVTNPTAAATCPARSFPHPTPAPGAAPDLDADATALFLTQPGRLAATHGTSAAQDVSDALDALVNHLEDDPELGVRPLVVPLDAYADVRDAYAAWDAAPCSVAAANDVAAQVTGIVRAVRAANPDLAYVTVVGGDDIVPMGRVPDLTRISNERDYAATFAARNPLSAAQAASYTLTDDVYGDTDPVDIGNGSALFVPRLAVGRLVETPTDITALLDGYRTGSGALDTSTGLVAGYDFLADSSAVVSNRLARAGRTVDDELIDAPGTPSPWNRDDLLTRLLPGDGPAPGVTSLNAHFDHTALLPSLGDAGGSDDLVSTADVAATAAGMLAKKVLFTMGCHAGLAVPDAYLPDGSVDPLALDWAQALAGQEVSVFVANTGYGIGDTSAIAYSERLMGLYAALLDGSVSAGQALAYAKQAYYGSLGAVGVYDLKVLQQTTFYGLPFWGVGTTAPPPPREQATSAGDLDVDSHTGLASATLTVESDFDEVTTDRGRYWQVEGADGPEDPQVTHYRPILPRTIRSVGVEGLVARGALVTSLDDHEVLGVDPVLSTPTIDLGASSPEVRVDDPTWGTRLATITTSRAPSGQVQNLVVVPGQFRGAASGAQGRQRLYDEVGVQVLYGPASDDDVTPPQLVTTDGLVHGSSVDFRVTASDHGSEVRRVLVGYRDADGTWRFVDLTTSPDGFAGSGQLSDPLPEGASVEYFAQAVDASGNVGFAANKAAGYAAGPGADDVLPTITATVSPAPNDAGWHRTDATVSFTCTDDGSGIADGACPPAQTVTDEGEHVVSGTVADRSGNEAGVSVTVRLDRTAPLVTLSGIPAAPTCTTTDEAAGRETSGVDQAATLTLTTTRVDGVPVTKATCAGGRDVAGNTASPVTHTYVAPLSASGFQAPVDNPPVVNVGKAGRTYPLKFVLRDAQGALVTSVAAVTRIAAVSVSCADLTEARDALEAESTGATGLRWDVAGQHFVYNWKTGKEPGCFRVAVALADGSTGPTALFRLDR